MSLGSAAHTASGIDNVATSEQNETTLTVILEGIKVYAALSIKTRSYDTSTVVNNDIDC